MTQSSILLSQDKQLLTKLVTCIFCVLLLECCEPHGSNGIVVKVAEIENYSTIKTYSSPYVDLELSGLKRTNSISITGPQGTFYTQIGNSTSRIRLDSSSLRSFDESVFNGFNPGTYTIGLGMSSLEQPENLSIEFAFNMDVKPDS